MLAATLAQQLLGAENTDLHHPLKKYQNPTVWDILMLERKIC
jgi:hypothetical protein